jgi:hypothetical protein
VRLSCVHARLHGVTSQQTVLFVCRPVTTSAAVMMRSAGKPSKRNTRFSSGASTLLMLVLLLLAVYRYAPHNDVSVNDGPHIRRWPHKIIIL